MDKNRYKKAILIGISVVIIVATIIVLLKRQADIDKGIKPSGIPNQAEIDKK